MKLCGEKTKQMKSCILIVALLYISFIAKGQEEGTIYGDTPVGKLVFVQQQSSADTPVDSDESTADFELFPNPFNNKITISNNTDTESKLRIYDIYGKLVYQLTDV